MTGRALILGAKSAIARAIARGLSEEGWDLILAARESGRLEPFASDIRLRTQRQVDAVEFDALADASFSSLPASLQRNFGEFDLVVLVFGYLGDQQRARRDTAEIEKILRTNFTAAAIVLSHLANYLVERGKPGGIIAVSSVAGDRGRQSNYFYGAAKGALTLFLQGLRNRLARTRVHVLTVKPGFVHTPMTADMEGMFLVAEPERVAGDILRAYKKRRDVLYTPWYWRYIMLLVKCIPECVFKRLQL